MSTRSFSPDQRNCYDSPAKFEKVTANNEATHDDHDFFCFGEFDCYTNLSDLTCIFASGN